MRFHYFGIVKVISHLILFVYGRTYSKKWYEMVCIHIHKDEHLSASIFSEGKA